MRYHETADRSWHKITSDGEDKQDRGGDAPENLSLHVGRRTRTFTTCWNTIHKVVIYIISYLVCDMMIVSFHRLGYLWWAHECTALFEKDHRIKRFKKRKICIEKYLSRAIGSNYSEIAPRADVALKTATEATFLRAERHALATGTCDKKNL